jgi:hypothetical protein
MIRARAAARRSRRSFALAAATLVALLEGTALAQAPATTASVSSPAPGPGAKRARHKALPVPEMPAAPPLADPGVSLTVDAPTPRGPWTMRLANDGEVPVRVIADARLLALDVTPRGATKAERCELPADMRPEDTAGRELVLPPKRAYLESFEPRLYCFSGRALGALSPTSVVVAHLGGRSRASEWEVTRIDGVSPAIAPRKTVDSTPFALYDERYLPNPDAAADTAPLVFEASPGVEGYSPDEVGVPVTLRNRSSRPVVVRFRPDMVGFEVMSPSGRELCTWPKRPSAPTHEVFTHLGAGASTSLTFDLAAYCREDSLDRAGLLSVRPWLDTRDDDGRSLGLTTFAGLVSARGSTFVRLHRGQTPELHVEPALAP